MTDTNELDGVSNVVTSEEEQQSLVSHEDTVSDNIPLSLLSYFESSKCRAALCEELILKELKDLTASHRTDAVMNVPHELDKDMMSLNVQTQVPCETDPEGNGTSTDTEKEEPTHSFSACSNSEGEAETDECRWCEKCVEVEVVRTQNSSMPDEEIKKSSQYEQQLREEQEDMQRKEEGEWKRSQRNFQKELEKIMEAEKLHQKELELMEKRAQEKLEQEFQLQQELIRDLQRQVNEERKKREEEEHKRMKEVEKKMEMEEKMKREEEDERREKEAEKNKREMQRVEEETRKKEDGGKRKIEEVRLKEMLRRKEEEQRRREEEGRRRVENEEEEGRKEEETSGIHEDMREKEEERKVNGITCRHEKTRREVEEEEMKRKEGNEEIKEDKTGKMENMMEEDKRRQTGEVIGLKEWREEEKTESENEEDKRSEEEQRMMMGHEVRMNEIRDLQKQENREEEQKIVNEKGGKSKKKEDEYQRTREVEEKMREEGEKTKREVEKKQNHEELKVKEIREKREEKKEGGKEEDGEVKLTEKDRKCEGQETGTAEDLMEEGKRRKTDEETEVKKQEKKIIDEEDERSEEEQRMKREEMKKKEQERKSEEGKRKVDLNMTEQMAVKEEENGETEDDIKRKKKEVEERHVGCTDERNEEEKTTKEKGDKQWGEEEEKMEEELRPEKGRDPKETCDTDEREMCPERKTKDEEKRQEENDEWRYKDDTSRIEGDKETEVKESEKEERLRLNEQKRDKDCMTSQITTESLTSSRPGPSQSRSTSSLQQDQRPAALPVCLPDSTERKRRSWMNDCVPWAKLSLQSKNKQKRSVDSRRRASRSSEWDSLPPVSPHTVLLSTGCRSLQQVTTVTLEDLPGCCLSTLSQCSHLQSLTVRRCGLKSLEGINHLPNLCYIDAQENDISFVDCGNMTSLRVLHLSHNKLTSIHGLNGAENLGVLELSHNFITRIAGLESMRSLQSLSLGHNQLISTKGLRDVSTLLHLDCSHNHLAVVDGLENNALLHTLNLKSNNVAEPPRLINHVLLRELHLDDNSISSLQGLTVCWLPLMHQLSAAQNRITLLPSMSDFVCLENLDLRFNCISEVQNVCESVEGCPFLRDVHLTGNPLQQESGWRSMLQKAVTGLRTIDGKKTDSLLSAPAVQQLSLASGSFLTFCQAQLKQTRDLQRQHSRELSNASSPLDAVKCSCRHFTDTLKLAVEQRFAHEYGDTTASAGQTVVDKSLDTDCATAGMCAGHSGVQNQDKELPIIQSWDNKDCSCLIPEEKSTTEISFHSSTTNGKTTSFHLKTAPESDLDSKNTAAAVIQQQWRKYREKCGNISRPPTAEKGGGGVGYGGESDSGSSNVDRSIAEQDCAAITIQAFWRGFVLRRRLASALAVVTWPDSGEDEAFEEVDVDGFVFDEAAEEKRWTLSLPEDSSSSEHHHVSEQPLSRKHLGASPVFSHYTTPSVPFWRPKQAWMVGEQVDSTEERTSPESSNRHKSPATASLLSGLSAKSEKIVEEWGFKDSNTALLMLKRAKKMRCKKQQQKTHQDPFVCQQGPVETRNRPAPHRRNHTKVCTAELGPQQEKQMEKVKRERVQQWLHIQSDRDSESERFLPEISSDILNGGRVQLVADPGYSEHLHHTSGLWASSSSAAQLSKERNDPRRNSASRPTGKEVPSPKRADTAPSKKERMSFRDNPVQLSGGWGGGKKRVKGQEHK